MHNVFDEQGIKRQKVIEFWKKAVEDKTIVEVLVNEQGLAGMRLNDGIIIRYKKDGIGLYIERDADGNPIVYS